MGDPFDEYKRPQTVLTVFDKPSIKKGESEHEKYSIYDPRGVFHA